MFRVAKAPLQGPFWRLVRQNDPHNFCGLRSSDSSFGGRTEPDHFGSHTTNYYAEADLA